MSAIEEPNGELERLVWCQSDIERRLGFRGDRFTRSGSLPTGMLAVLLTVIFFVSITPLSDTRVGAMMVQRGLTPYAITLLSFWCLAILFFKSCKLAFQRRALGLSVLPEDPSFVLSVNSVDQVLMNLSMACDDPRRFVLLNRISIALSNLRNLGRVTDVDGILRSQAEHDESLIETSYALLRGFVWAIPVLGFIGTVSGLSSAIGGFGKVLAKTADTSVLIDSLREVTGGLAVAFETTFLALVCALSIQLAVVFLKKREEEFLDDCSDYCQRNIVNRLRLSPFETN